MNAVFATALAIVTIKPLPAHAAENLKLNQHLDYTSDSQDGPLITADHLEVGAVSGKPAYAIFYGEGCFNSKRQARRTVELYEKYKGRVQFVVVDLDRPRSPAQEELVKKFYKGYIPHVVVLDRDGKTAYNSSGEVEEGEISKVLEKALAQ
jgi:thiol-disulfide isomerase/thioredoxin